MNHFHPDKLRGAADKAICREIASHYCPLIGPYDSGDPDVLEYHALTMKLAGIDGAIIDWYGKDDVYDYSSNHEHTLQFIKALKKAGLKFAICYEDQTVPNIVNAGKIPKGDVVAYGKELFRWMQKEWFQDPDYLRVDDKPALLVFGPQFYKGNEWSEMTHGLDLGVYGVNGAFKFSNGGFGWPWPSDGLMGIQRFYAQARTHRSFIADAFPRFHDIYKEAQVHDSWGSVPDDDGQTFRQTFEWAKASGSHVIQITTWNDWGEGTQVEPSVEFGYRDLEYLQTATTSAFSKQDLRLPLRLYTLRKLHKDTQGAVRASAMLFAGDVKGARKLLSGRVE